jgi:adenylate cyclase
LAHVDLVRAREQLTLAAEIFRKADHGLELMATERTLAAVLLASGDRPEAEALLSRVVDMADERSAVLNADEARRQLAAMGVDAKPATARPTQSATEVTERLVTVLFVDIRGYTTMSARDAPDRMADTVASFHRWARQEIERHHGLVDKYEGDAVMATFNVTSPRLDHALQALQAAIAIRDKAMAASLPVGAGIAVGPAVVGRLTADGHVSAYGEVTNLASRLQGQAAAGEVLISEEAHRRTRDWLSGQRLTTTEEALQLKGLDQPVKSFRLRAESRAPASS